MLSNLEIWTAFVKRVVATSIDPISAAKRLHKGHLVIFGKSSAQDFQDPEQADRTKRAMWTACLKCAEQSFDHVDDVANRLIKAHKIIFGGNNDHQ